MNKESQRWRSKDGRPLTWDEVYGPEKAALMRRKRKANRKPPAAQTSFAKHWGLKPLSQRDKEAVEVWERGVNKAAFLTINSPYHPSTKLHQQSKKEKKRKERFPQFFDL